MTGTIESIWRYPVKSMRGEDIKTSFISFAGVMGDRIFALSSTSSPKEFPWHTAREQEDLVMYQANFKEQGNYLPGNVTEALGGEVPLNPAYPEPEAFDIEVTNTAGHRFNIKEPAFLDSLKDESEGELSLHYTQRNMVDCRPITLFSLQTVQQLSDELDLKLDKRRFRSNFYIDWDDKDGFYEDQLVGKKIKIGDTVEMMVIEKDPRCKFITIDPETADTNPRILRHVTKKYGGFAGVYAAVLKEGIINAGDRIEILG